MINCPNCDGNLNDSTPICDKCGFDISEFDKVLRIPSDEKRIINDFAHIFDEESKSRLEKRIIEFTKNTDFEYRLVIIDSSQPRSPREFAFWLFNRWQIGGEKHAGILVLLALEEKRIEVEVGHSLEKYVTDEEAGGVLQHHAVPFFKKGDFARGLYHALDMLGRIVEHVYAEEKSNEE